MNDPSDSSNKSNNLDDLYDLDDLDEDLEVQEFDGPISVYPELRVKNDSFSEIYPIETAPTDGTNIFVADHEMLARAHWHPCLAKDREGNPIGAWKNDELGFAWVHDEERGPTHWWPLAFMLYPSNYTQ